MKAEFQVLLVNPETDEPEWVDIECNIIETRDPYATGDSPTEYDVEDIKAVGMDGFKWEDLSSMNLTIIMDKAIEYYKEGG